MAVSVQRPVLTAVAIVKDTDANATSENDVKAGAATLYFVEIDNGLNATAVYLKLYNAAAPTVGTTVPDMILRCPGSSKFRMAIPEGISFGTGVSFACVTGAGTAGTTGPTNDVAVIIVC